MRLKDLDNVQWYHGLTLLPGAWAIARGINFAEVSAWQRRGVGLWFIEQPL